MVIAAGEKLPHVTLYEGTPDGEIHLDKMFAGKKGILFGVPGAFTPGCSKTHLPGYVEKAQELKSKGIEVIACMSVNDPFVMSAWGQAHKADGNVRMLADTQGEVTRKLGLELDLKKVLGSVRCKRFAMIIDDGVVTEMALEPDGTGMTCSLAPAISDKL